MTTVQPLTDTPTMTDMTEVPSEALSRPGVVVVGGGPAGLAAAQVLLEAGVPVDLFDAMPSVARKFLIAGKGGLNLTHAEPFDRFVGRYREASDWLRPQLAAFGAEQMRAWSESLGVPTFVGSSQRVFPVDMKAAPLLRAWLHRLRALGLRTHMRHRWVGWDEDGAWCFERPQVPQVKVSAPVAVLALGGGSWARLGSDGRWCPVLAGRGVDVRPLAPSNGGFLIDWSDHLRARHAGDPVKNVALSWTDWRGHPVRQAGEFVVSADGVEGSLIYAASADWRRQIETEGAARAALDLLPQRTADDVLRALAHPRGSRSLSSHLQSRLNLGGVKLALLNEFTSAAQRQDVPALAQAIKALPLTLRATRALDEAISSAGGVALTDVDASLMLRQLPGVFCAGEMLDWEAPTGGYLLTACMATGRRAGQGALGAWLATLRAPC